MINRVDLKGLSQTIFFFNQKKLGEIFIIPNDVTVYGAKGFINTNTIFSNRKIRNSRRCWI